MNEQLQEQMAQILEVVKTSVTQTSGFVIEQMPLIVQELLLYKRISYTMGFITPLLIIILVVFIWKKYILTNKKVMRKGEDFNGLIFLTAIMVIPSIMVMFINFLNMIRVWVAPRVFLIEYVSGLIKSSN